MPAVLLFSLLLTLSDHPALDRLEAAAAAGRITLSEKLRIIEDAVREPARLPEPWRAWFAAHPVPPEEGTARLVEAFQQRLRHDLVPVAGYPAELPFHFDSETVPVRVYYGTESQAALARLTLEAAEYSWVTEIDVFGFYAPPITTPEGRYRIYVGDTGMGGGGYCSPVGTYQETPWDDCHTYIVVDPRNPRYYIDSLVAHELNHATQAAMDCLEPVSFWENTATYMKFAVYPSSMSYVRYYMDYYQSLPYWSVAGGDQNSMYWYGGFVWAYFLAERYGEPGEGAIFLRQLWERSMQSTGNVRNEPHYFDALEAMLAERQDGGLHEAFFEFSRVRWFVDENATDDYDLLPNADELTPSPLLTDSVEIDLPQVITPQKIVWPRPYGVNYYLLNAGATYRRNTTVAVTGEGLWHLQVVALEDGHRVVESGVGEGGASLSFDPGDRTLLIVGHVGDPDYLPGSNPREGEEYELEIGSTVPLPQVTSVTPAAAWQGSTVDVQVYGAHFQEGVSAAFLPAGVLEVEGSELLSDGQFRLRVRIPAGALTGPYALIVTNPDGGMTRIESSVTVLRREETASGGCVNAGRVPGNGALWMGLLALVVGLGVRRRRVR